MESRRRAKKVLLFLSRTSQYEENALNLPLRPRANNTPPLGTFLDSHGQHGWGGLSDGWKHFFFVLLSFFDKTMCFQHSLKPLRVLDCMPEDSHGNRCVPFNLFDVSEFCHNK